MPTKLNSTTKDSAGKVVTDEKLVYAKSATTINVPNPKLQLITPLDQTLIELRKQKSEKENALLNIRPQLEKEISSKVGFLDELKIMSRIISGSVVAQFVWFIWFFFLMGLELLVLFSKWGDKKNDYDETIMHQMNLQMKKLQVLARNIAKDDT